MTASKRHFVPGLWGRSGAAIVKTHCSGCDQGCDFCDAEFNRDVHPDAERVIRAPILNRTDRERYEFWRRWSKLVAIAAVAALVALLKLAGAQAFNHN